MNTETEYPLDLAPGTHTAAKHVSCILSEESTYEKEPDAFMNGPFGVFGNPSGDPCRWSGIVERTQSMIDR